MKGVHVERACFSHGFQKVVWNTSLTSMLALLLFRVLPQTQMGPCKLFPSHCFISFPHFLAPLCPFGAGCILTLSDHEQRSLFSLDVVFSRSSTLLKLI